MEKASSGKLIKAMKDRKVSHGLKSKLTRTLIFPVVTHGGESWTMRRADQRIMGALKFYVWKSFSVYMND